MQRRLFTFLALVLMMVQFNAFAQSPTLDEAKKMIENEQFAQAEKALNLLIETDRKNPEFYYWKGTAQIGAEAYEKAKETFAAGIKVRGKYPYNHVGMGRVLVYEGSDDQANEVLQKALTYNKGRDIDVNFAVASAYLEANKIKDAEVLLYQAQESAPDNPKSYIALGDLYMAKKTSKLALNQYEQAILKDPSFVPGYTHIGQLKIEKEEYDEGAKYLHKAMELAPDFAPSYKYMGELWFRAGQYEQARDNYQKYVSLTQNDLGARLRYADFLFLSGNYAEVISELGKAEKDTVTSLMLRLTGMSHHQMGHLDKAQDYMDRYFKRIDPKYTIFQDYEVYGRIMLEKGNQTKADEYFAKAVEMDYERVTLYQDLAKEYNKEAKALRASDPQKAIETYLREAHYRTLFINNKPQKALGDYYRLGLAYYYGQEFQNALNNFNEVTKLKEDYLQGHMWAFRSANKIDQVVRDDTTTTASSWLSKDPAQRIIDLLGDKDAEELSKSEKAGLLAAYQVLAFYKFNPEGDDNYNCDAAKFFIEEIQKISPSYSSIQPIVEYCEAIKAQGQSGNN